MITTLWYVAIALIMAITLIMVVRWASPPKEDSGKYATSILVLSAIWPIGIIIVLIIIVIGLIEKFLNL